MARIESLLSSPMLVAIPLVAAGIGRACPVARVTEGLIQATHSFFCSVEPLPAVIATPRHAVVMCSQYSGSTMPKARRIR